MKRKRLSPYGLLLESFAVLIFVGGVALWLPFAANGVPVRFLDALFTSTSAVCITGLTVIDTATRFSREGQITIMILIQLGGLGIVTLSTFFLVVLGRKVSINQREILSSTHAPLAWVDRRRLVKRIVLYTFLIEGGGALVLFMAWWPQYEAGEAFFHALFHAVSAFCNAGFSTFSTNLMAFHGDWLVNLPIMALIILGGLGFLVLLEIENFLRFGRRRFSLHARLVLLTTTALILAGALGFLVLEYRNVLQSLTWAETILVCLFQSVTPRTAGFNTVDYGQLGNATLLMTMGLMFVGGAPGSTAGGVKVTTLAILSALAWSRLQGKAYLNLFRRTVPEKNINEALVLLVIAVVLLSVATLFLQMSELGSRHEAESRGRFLDLNFEAVSAFGTVGLSTGVTPGLTDAGKLLIMGLMYIGRLGPLTIILYLSQRAQKVNYQHYQEDIIVG